jgi:PAS domain S-box-containing protein
MEARAKQFDALSREAHSPDLRGSVTVLPDKGKIKHKETSLMHMDSKFIWIGVALGAFFWVAESAVHTFVFHEGSFLHQVHSPALHEIWMRLIVVALFIAFGIYAQFMFIRHRRAEEATDAVNAELDQIFQTAADGMRLVDKDFNVLRVNQTFAAMSGIDIDEAIGKKCYELFSGPQCHTPDCPLTRILGGEERIEHDAKKERSDGSIVPCIVTTTPFRGPNGELIGIVEDFKDIAPRKHAEEALRESEERYRTVLEASPDPTIVYDMVGNTVYVNPAFTSVFGWTLEELFGKKTDYIPEENWPETKAMIHKVLAGESFSGVETRRYTKQRNPVDVSISAAIYRDSDGNPAGSIHTLRDTTERKRLKAQLEQAQKMEAVGTLAGGIAHDFNNLLMSIQGNVSIMQMGMESTHPYYDRLKNIEKQVHSGARLTSQLLGYARKGRYEVKPTNLNQLVRETCDTFGRTKKEVTIQQDLAEDLFTVEADSGQIELVLLNLFVNAADAMPGGGHLTLKTMNTTHKDMAGKLYQPKPGNYILLTVEDTGTGMDKDTIQRIFDPFFTTKERGRGTGFGLASAYGIIRGHGGYVDVESKEGHGTTFRIYLPASESKVQTSVKQNGSIIKGTETVLLVDDEESIRQVGQEILEAMDYRVLVARHGVEAVDLYASGQDEIDLVILDMVMPNMGGGETYDRMKEINPDIKVLLSSGFSVDGEASDILRRGCNGFIQKPFTMKELSAKIRKMLENG